jgi:uncharacterized membrane protein YphA (DoxX/SURF4 family)
LRYLANDSWDRGGLVRIIMAMFLAYMLLFWVTSGLMYFDRMSLDPRSVAAYFLGDPDQEFGRPPRPYASLVEASHMHLFAMGMLLMVLTHLLLVLPASARVKSVLVAVTFATALLNELSNWLVRFIHAGFAYVKVASFLAMEVSLLALIVILARHRTGEAFFPTCASWGRGPGSSTRQRSRMIERFIHPVEIAPLPGPRHRRGMPVQRTRLADALRKGAPERP